MSPAAESIPVPQLRALAARRVSAEGLRPVARAIGLHPSSVLSFIEGATPRESTRRKLTAWYVREMAAGNDAPDAATVRAAIEILLYSVPPPRLEGAVRDLVSRLAEIHSNQGGACPIWLQVLLQGRE